MDVESPCSTLIANSSTKYAFSAITYRNLRIRIPLFKGLELWKKKISGSKNRWRIEPRHTFKTQVFTELVHGTYSPLASLLDTHDLDDSQACWSALSTIWISWVFSCILQNISKVVVGEFAIGTTFKTIFQIINRMLHIKRCSSKAYLPIVLSFGGVARVARIAPPKAKAKSCTSILSNGLPPILLLKKSWVHFSSAWDVVACHCG